MTDLAQTFAAFHFLRPEWLTLLPVLALIWALARRRAAVQAAPADGLSPHLRAALTVGGGGRRRLAAIDLVVAALGLMAMGAAGPTWSRTPDPFVAQIAPMVIALKVSASMESPDLAPTRLDRAKHKIRDLLDLRAGGRTALIAYAGTAHLAVPMTGDAGVMMPYLDGLVPDVMPTEGANATAALALAQTILAREAGPGGVLFVLDALSSDDAAMLDGPDAPDAAFLLLLPEGVDDPGLGRVTGAKVVRAGVDDGDVAALDRMLAASWRRAQLDDDAQPWEDRGWLLAWPAALLTLLWFQRGWTMRWAVLLALGLLGAPGGPAHAGPPDWFATPDQQGALAMLRRDYTRAAELFADPMQRGYALFRDGQYEAAAEALARIETPEAAFVQGLAHVRSRKYRDGVRAFETALARDPDLPGAAENLETARQIVVYIETTRAQSDTGEDAGLGADDVVFDNEEAKGADTRITATPDGGGGLLTAEKWMTLVDTRTGDFLRQRFAIEAAATGK
jgi:Ca-activated chloride channel family protein